MNKESFIYGINSVTEALEHQSERIVKIFFLENHKNNRVRSVIRQSNKKIFPVHLLSQSFWLSH